jgi:hypothetical protein
MPAVTTEARMATRYARTRDDGSIVALTAIALIPLVVGLAIVVDSGRVWAERTNLQNAVEVTAASAASAWIRTGSVCPSSVRDYLGRDGASPDSVDCTTSGTNRNGTLTVAAVDAAPLTFVDLLGRSSARIAASTTVRIGSPGALIGVWPVALCDRHPSLLAWKNSGFTLATNYTISMQSNPARCGTSVNGNWGVLDFNGGSNSTAEAVQWVQHGYDGAVEIGDLILGNPGAVSNSIGIASMFGKSVLIALYDLAEGRGSAATFRISGFTRAVLIAAKLTGAAAARSLTVRFETGIVDRATASAGTGSDFGLTTWAICAYDNKGHCS